MYHEVTHEERRRRKIRRIIAVVALVLVCVAGFFGYQAVSRQLREQGAVSVRNAILDAAMQCCAVEGSYPSNLEHLENSYGLSINHSDYIITYQVYADNVMPSVVVVPR